MSQVTPSIKNNRLPLVVILLVGFLDHLGIGLVYPIFSVMLFDPQSPFVTPDTSLVLRGFYLGVLYALTPLSQFFACPYYGTLSDVRGRKGVLLLTVMLGVVSYLIAVIGIYFHSLLLLFAYRFLLGIADGSLAVGQAALADISTESNKARYFSLLNMAVGAGFTLGPFFGGRLAGWLGLETPFIAAGIMMALSCLLIYLRFPETHPGSAKKSLHFLSALGNLTKAFGWKELRILLLSSFLFMFGWSFFMEFMPILLMHRFNFDAAQIGNFFAWAGLTYALSAGCLTAPIIKRISPHHLYIGGLIGMSFYLPLFLLIKNPIYIVLFTPVLQYCVAIVFPTATTLVSNLADHETQGEVLGLYQSVNSFALIISPFCAGSLVASYPSLAVWGGAIAMLVAGLIYFIQAPHRSLSQA